MRLANVLAKVCLFTQDAAKPAGGSGEEVFSASLDTVLGTSKPPSAPAPPSSTHFRYPLCWTPEERRAAYVALYSLMHRLHDASQSFAPAKPRVAALIPATVQSIVAHAGAGRGALALPNDAQWAFGETDDGRGSSGYVGLRNLG